MASQQFLFRHCPTAKYRNRRLQLLQQSVYNPRLHKTLRGGTQLAPLDAKCKFTLRINVFLRIPGGSDDLEGTLTSLPLDVTLTVGALLYEQAWRDVHSTVCSVLAAIRKRGKLPPQTGVIEIYKASSLDACIHPVHGQRERLALLVDGAAVVVVGSDDLAWYRNQHGIPTPSSPFALKQHEEQALKEPTREEGVAPSPAAGKHRMFARPAISDAMEPIVNSAEAAAAGTEEENPPDGTICRRSLRCSHTKCRTHYDRVLSQRMAAETLHQNVQHCKPGFFCLSACGNPVCIAGRAVDKQKKQQERQIFAPDSVCLDACENQACAGERSASVTCHPGYACLRACDTTACIVGRAEYNSKHGFANTDTCGPSGPCEFSCFNHACATIRNHRHEQGQKGDKRDSCQTPETAMVASPSMEDGDGAYIEGCLCVHACVHAQCESERVRAKASTCVSGAVCTTKCKNSSCHIMRVLLGIEATEETAGAAAAAVTEPLPPRCFCINVACGHSTCATLRASCGATEDIECDSRSRELVRFAIAHPHMCPEIGPCRVGPTCKVHANRASDDDDDDVYEEEDDLCDDDNDCDDGTEDNIQIDRERAYYEDTEEGDEEGEGDDEIEEDDEDDEEDEHESGEVFDVATGVTTGMSSSVTVAESNGNDDEEGEEDDEEGVVATDDRTSVHLHIDTTTISTNSQHIVAALKEDTVRWASIEQMTAEVCSEEQQTKVVVIELTGCLLCDKTAAARSTHVHVHVATLEEYAVWRTNKARGGAASAVYQDAGAGVLSALFVHVCSMTTSEGSSTPSAKLGMHATDRVLARPTMLVVKTRMVHEHIVA